MNLRLKGLLLSISLVLASQVKAGEPCGAVLCLSNNETAPWECKEAVDGYFDIRVYRKRKFDPGATSIKRYQEVMDKCDGAQQSDKDRINAKYGTLEHSPFTFQ